MSRGDVRPARIQVLVFQHVEEGVANYSCFVEEYGCASAGQSVEQAIDGLKETIEDYFEVCKEEGWSIPDVERRDEVELDKARNDGLVAVVDVDVPLY